ncbi:hypothetical protein CEXT_264411 [Caerostris extrusa]|uniref:Uncharacterized protein n=1 Tax=Caerostris extrusa TaxID=172846 RepID=A0AAV4RQK2_CAEEX|nr:hypothetical protein CEXT_264411 [Caerostris extrusa]
MKGKQNLQIRALNDTLNSPDRFINVLFGAPEKENLIKRAPSADLALYCPSNSPKTRCNKTPLNLQHNFHSSKCVQISSAEQKRYTFYCCIPRGEVNPEEELKRGGAFKLRVVKWVLCFSLAEENRKRIFYCRVPGERRGFNLSIKWKSLNYRVLPTE